MLGGASVPTSGVVALQAWALGTGSVARTKGALGRDLLSERPLLPQTADPSDRKGHPLLICGNIGPKDEQAQAHRSVCCRCQHAMAWLPSPPTTMS